MCVGGGWRIRSAWRISTSAPLPPPWDVSRARRAEAEALIAADKSGTSDPFAVVTLLDVRSGKELHAKEKLKTEVIKKTLAPRWDATATFGAHAAADAVAASVLRVALFDHDRMSTSHDPLGEVRGEVGSNRAAVRKRESNAARVRDHHAPICRAS